MGTGRGEKCADRRAVARAFGTIPILARLLAILLLAGAAITAVPSPATASSPFRWRGIVEGAYGPPWTDAQRVRMIRWMGAHDFNAYVHAPKDDVYGRSYWRDPYPPAQQARFSREVRLARRLGVAWIPDISPALPLLPSAPNEPRPPSRDLCFSCASDMGVVMAKFAPFVKAGARTVMVSFDDVSKVMTHPEDIARYGVGDEAFGRANGEFLSRLQAAYAGTGVRILTVGADYSGSADTAYLRGLRSTLAPGIEVMWTGTGIPSAAWAPSDAQQYGSRIGREPVVWENWTNNDTAGNATPAGAARIFLGPYIRRADVAGTVRGFFFNPMNEADLNKLPLATAADWMRSPTRYRPRASWLGAVRTMAGTHGSPAPALRAWAETSYSTKLSAADAPTFVRRRDAFLTAYRGDALWPVAKRALLRELRLVENAGRTLRRLPDHAFVSQAGPWLDAARDSAAAGRLATGLLSAERPALSVRRRRDGSFRGHASPPSPSHAMSTRVAYRAARERATTEPRFVFGWRGGVAFEIPPYTVPRNTLDSYFDAVDALDNGWQPRSAEASRGVSVTVAGKPLPIDPDGGFALARSACGKLVVATDAAGGRSGRRLHRCAR